MVLPDNILEAVNEGDVSAVVAWLDGGGDVNDTVVGPSEHFIEGDTMLMAVAQVEESFTRAHIALAKLLLQRGADVNGHSGMHMGDGFTAIHCCLNGIRNTDDPDRSLLMELLGIYLAAGADLTGSTAQASQSNLRYAPLGMALECNFWCGFHDAKQRSAFETVKLLLRHGAPIDVCAQEPDPTQYLGDFGVTAEEILRRTETQDRLRAMPYNLAADEYSSRASSSSPTFAPLVAGNSTFSTCRRRCSASGCSSRAVTPGASSASARGRRVKSNSSSRRRFRTSFAGECSSTGTRARNVLLKHDTQ